LREKGRWIDNHLDSLRKFFEEMRLQDVKDIKMKVFKESTSKSKNTRKVAKAEFESDLLDNTTLNRKAVNNILEIWDYKHTSSYDLEELQTCYQVYCRFCNFAESKIRSIFEKLQAFFDLTEEEKDQKKKQKVEEDEVLRNRQIASLW